MTTESGPKNPLVSSFDTYMETEEATDMLRYIQASKPSAVLFKAFRAGRGSAADLLNWIENEASRGLTEGDAREALTAIKWKIKDGCK